MCGGAGDVGAKGRTVSVCLAVGVAMTNGDRIGVDSASKVDPARMAASIAIFMGVSQAIVRLEAHTSVC